MQYRFHVNLFARPEQTIAGASIQLRSVHVTPLRSADGAPPSYGASLPDTFDEALAALKKLPRLDAEPDGFFVLAGGRGPTLWRVSGHLFDYHGRLHRVELHGDCPVESFDAILACLGWPQTPLAFELVREGVALDEPDFRAWASRDVPAPGAR